MMVQLFRANNTMMEGMSAMSSCVRIISVIGDAFFMILQIFSFWQEKRRTGTGRSCVDSRTGLLFMVFRIYYLER